MILSRKTRKSENTKPKAPGAFGFAFRSWCFRIPRLNDGGAGLDDLVDQRLHAVFLMNQRSRTDEFSKSIAIPLTLGSNQHNLEGRIIAENLLARQPAALV